MSAYTLREWECLPYGEGNGCIPLDLAGKLAACARESGFAKADGAGVLEERRHDLRARGVVGVLVADGGSLEILPKIDVDGPTSQVEQNATIRKRLVHMLGVALDLKIETGLMTELDWQNETLLDILIRVFCTKLLDALRRGMPRRYLSQEEDLSALRGRLDVTQQFTRHAANPSRLACRFDELSEDIALNRVMKATVKMLSQVSRSAENRQSLRELTFIYAEVTQMPSAALPWGDIVLDRTNNRWAELVGLAKLLLGNRYQTTSSGRGSGMALLFEMNLLFEEYIGRMVKRALAGSEYEVTTQGGRRFCLTALCDGRGIFQTKPDILIWRGTDVVHVIDTKWKRMSAHIDDRKQGVSQGDIYQMMAYAQLYEAPRLTLLYPHHAGIPSPEGLQAQFNISGLKTIIETASIDIALGENLRGRLVKILSSGASRSDAADLQGSEWSYV